MDFSQPILKVNTPYYKIEISTYSPIKLKCYNDSTVKIDINPKSSHNNKRNKYSCVPAITEASISPEFDKVHKHKHHNHHKHSSDYHYKKDYYTYNDDLEVTPETPTFTSQYSRYSNPIYQETQNIYAPQHESYDYMQEVQNLYSRPNVPPSYPYYYSPMKTYSKSNIISNISQPSYNYGSISNNINVNDYNDDSDSDYNNDNNYTPSYIPSKYMVSPGLSNSPRIEEYNNNELLEDKDDYSIKNEDLEEKEVEELVKNQEEQYHVEDEMIQDINQNQEDNSLESSSEAEYNTINFLMNKCKIYDGDDYISYIMREWKFNGSDYLRMHHEYLMYIFPTDCSDEEYEKIKKTPEIKMNILKCFSLYLSSIGIILNKDMYEKSTNIDLLESFLETKDDNEDFDRLCKCLNNCGLESYIANLKTFLDEIEN